MIRRRKDRTRRQNDGRPAFERALFSIMGPAQIGENKAPEAYVPDETANYCHKCHQLWDQHKRVHSRNMTYTVCPRSQDSPSTPLVP